MPSLPPLLQLSDVHKRYGAHHALRGLSATVSAGTIGLLGPNGAGKSTLLRLLLGLLDFEGGALVLGLDPQRQPAVLRAQVGYMPERDCLLPRMNAVELCAYAAELSGLPAAAALQRAHQTLELCGLGDKRYQAVTGFSTGMKQRVKLAQALVHDPKLLLLDEPTNGLDPDGREELLALIASLPGRSGCSVVLSTHLLGDVERVCDQVLLLHEGQLLFTGTLEALRTGGQEHLYEVRVKLDRERLAQALLSRGFSVTREEELLVVGRADPGAVGAIFDAAEAEGLQVRHLQPRKLSLESAFVRAVRGAEDAEAQS